MNIFTIALFSLITTMHAMEEIPLLDNKAKLEDYVKNNNARAVRKFLQTIKGQDLTEQENLLLKLDLTDIEKKAAQKTKGLVPQVLYSCAAWAIPTFASGALALKAAENFCDDAMLASLPDIADQAELAELTRTLRDQCSSWKTTSFITNIAVAGSTLLGCVYLVNVLQPAHTWAAVQELKSYKEDILAKNQQSVSNSQELEIIKH